MEDGKRSWLRRGLSLIVGAGIVLSFLPSSLVLAAPLKGYEASAVSISGNGKLTFAPGEKKTFTISLQNIGTESWLRDSGAFVSLYTYGPKYRTSVFQDTTWFSGTQPAKILESSVKPGGVATVSFVMKAPATPGTYPETFKLAAEDVAWIPGGEFTVNAVVTGSPSTSTSTSSTVPSSVTTPSTDGLAAMVLLRSSKKITAKGGATVDFTVGVKNTGTVLWTTRELRSATVSSASTSSSSTIEVIKKTGDTVSPGAMDLISFRFTAPTKKGTHTVSYQLVVDGAVVPDLQIDIPVEVTSNAPNAVKAPTTSDESTSGSYIDEPIIRAGVLTVDEETDDQAEITCESDWKLYDGNGALLAELDADEEVNAFYKKGKYWFNRGKGLESTSYYLRFVPNTKNAVCTMTNFDRRETRGSKYEDNTFRNILELRYNSTYDRVWLINELPMEMYLRGLAETSNISHLEFQKALITGARTYAYYHWQRATKHASEYYHVDAYYDQVYKGYGQEQRTPRLTESVEATRGRIVEYEGKTAITPYFSRSDGRTRDWSEVWGGEVAWLKSVPTPCDQGKTLWGHGVGMSASAALCMANEGEKWDDILKYFYTGVTLNRLWK